MIWSNEVKSFIGSEKHRLLFNRLGFRIVDILLSFWSPLFDLR